MPILCACRLQYTRGSRTVLECSVVFSWRLLLGTELFIITIKLTQSFRAFRIRTDMRSFAAVLGFVLLFG